MVSLSNNTQGNVNITTNNSGNINLKSNNDTDINANTNGNSQRAKSWAVGEGLIDGVDYSAKYYAQDAATASGRAEQAKDAAQGYAQQAEQAKEDIEAELDNYVPTSRQINGKDLTDDITLTSSDIGALSDTTKYGYSIALSLNTTDYKLTLTLKDQDGTTLSTKTVDFPIESVVVNGSYDSTNQKIVLTLQNGTTIDVPVGDLVAGLQTEITSTNKLDADLVDDTNATNKFVTANEKTTWNNKQNAISDLSTIRTNAANGANAYTTIQGYGNIVTHNASEFVTNTSLTTILTDYVLSSDLSTTLANYVTSANLTTILDDYALTADVPTKTSELTNDSNFATISQIPTVGNGTVTINQGGTQKGTFTLNQTGNVTIDLDAGGGGVDVQAYTATEVETLWESI